MSNEVQGRLLLWQSAVYETQHILNMAISCEVASKADLIPKHIRDKRGKLFDEFRRNQPNYKEGTLHYSHLVAFNKIWPEPFPDAKHFLSLTSSNTMLAVIIFSQIYMSGYKDDGAASSNNKEFRDKHLDNILVKVFKSSQVREEYEKFIKVILDARNRMLGHADAEAFEIVHGTPVTGYKMYRSAIDGIDIRYWYQFLEPLLFAIAEYGQTIRRQ